MVARLSDLPISENSFWKDAEKHRMEPILKVKHEHYFKIVDKEIVCECGVGYLFTGKEIVKNGKLDVTP